MPQSTNFLALLAKRHHEARDAFNTLPPARMLTGTVALMAAAYVVEFFAPVFVVAIWVAMTGNVTSPAIAALAIIAIRVVRILTLVTVVYVFSFEPDFWAFVARWGVKASK